MIQAYGIFTPSRKEGLGYEGKAQTTATQVPWNTRNVPKGFCKPPVSIEMEEKEIHQEGEGTQNSAQGTETVNTNGGCIKVTGGPGAGYGICWGEGDRRNEARALRGQAQTETNSATSRGGSSCERAEQNKGPNQYILR